MGNARMRTKLRVITEESLPARVRNIVQNAMDTYGQNPILIHFKQVVEWEERPSISSNPHWTKIVFHGATRFNRPYAIIDCLYGKWDVPLSMRVGLHDYGELKDKPATRTWGTPTCIEPSDEWRETKEQRIARLQIWIEQGVL